MEYEARFKINNVNEFIKKLNKLGANIIKKTPFTDLYFKPINGYFKDGVTLRVRKYNTISKILFQKHKYKEFNGVKFKESDGKIELFSSTYESCVKILRDLNFEPWIKIVKSKLFGIELNDMTFGMDKINDLGWFVEIENNDLDEFIKNFNNFVKKTGLKKYTHKCILELYAEKFSGMI